MSRQRLEVAKVEERLTIVKILVQNGYAARILTEKSEGKRVTYVEYWKEEK